MRNLRALLLVSCLAVFGVATSHADSVNGYFNLDTSLNPVQSAGQVTFTLNGNGTINASLVFQGPGTIQGFGFNSSVVDLLESGFTPTAPDNPYGWGDSFGSQNSGFLCYACGAQESWVIGNSGDFTSVLQVLDGGSASTVDFYLTTSSGEWGANRQSNTPSATPEPGSLILFGSGALTLVGAIRRRLAR